MIKPVSYLQTDPRWAGIDYSAKGESTTIGKAGCGPTCMAMVIATLVDASVTPKETVAWSLKNKFKALHQGTYYSYFIPQGKFYNIGLTMLNTSNIYKLNTSVAKSVRENIKNELKNGNWIIACMGKGVWTSSGHFVLAYATEDKYVRINDPNSTKSWRTSLGDLNTWLNEIKYAWKVDVNGCYKNKNSKVEEDDEVVEKTKIKVNGKNKTINRILKEDSNYVNLREICDILGVEISYDEKNKIPVIVSK